MKALTPCLTLLLAGALASRAAGKQLTGAHAPAATPALSPADAQRQFVVPDGFEVRLFAAEPDVINPVAMTWDERGRLWVLELYEYPSGAPAGKKGRDRIRILEDTDNDGRADKFTVFADGLSLATGLALGNGGVYLGQAPDLLFLQDTNHDDRADTRTVLLTGFGKDDRHELLNGFTWGPDGWLYFTHGIFTRSKVKIPEASEPGVEVTAALARYHPRTKKFEVFAEGTSNPWGVDFDATGNAFVSACVIDHLFHLAPGGTYQRQAGSPSNPYAYEILPSIVGHKHHMAAYSGICVYQGDQFPPEYQGRVFMGNIHQNAINHDRLIPNGASFKAVAEKDFLTTKDGWFMPVSEQVGPDGALWIADWYDKYPCYQNALADPEGVDREHGRIWRVVYVGNEAGKKIPPRPDVKMDLTKLQNERLLRLLEHSNVWQRRTARKILNERFHLSRDESGFGDVFKGLERIALNARTPDARFDALFTLLSIDAPPTVWYPPYEFLKALSEDSHPGIRASEIRLRMEYLDGLEAGHKKPSKIDRFTQAEEQIWEENSRSSVVKALLPGASDSDPIVRLLVATICRQRVSSSLTVDREINTNAPVAQILEALVKSSADAKDPLLPYMIWLASEPLLARNPEPDLRWLAENGASTKPLSEKLTYKAMRRLCDTGEAEKVNLTVSFVTELAAKDEALAVAALDGLLEAQQARPLRPTTDTKDLFEKLAAHASAKVRERGQQLAALWGDVAAMEKLLAVAGDAHAGVDERVKAIQAMAQLKIEAVRTALLKVVAGENPEPVLIEALRGLGRVNGDSVGGEILEHWQRFPPETRRAASEVLVSRRRWLLNLLAALENKQVSPVELSTSAVRTLLEFTDEGIRQRAEQAIGRIRPANADKQKLIAAKKAMILAGKADLAAGHELARKVCFVCHKLNGEGGEVGPDLTGVGRSSLDALLANVIDPNQIVGKGYENVILETKDDRTVSGRLIEETPTQVKLLASGPKEEIVARSDIAKLTVSELSVMPEGLEQMPDADFRNLVGFILNPAMEAKK